MFKESIKLKGRFEIVNNETGEKVLDVNNLVMLITRAAILQVMFNDDKVMYSINNMQDETDSIINSKYPEGDNNTYQQIPGYRRMICGFCFGCNGNEPNINPAIVRVPSPLDIAKISSVTDDYQKFLAIPMIEYADENGTTIIKNTAGSYEKLDEIKNLYLDKNTNSIMEQEPNGPSMVKYFNLTDCIENSNSDNICYCKTFNNLYSTTTIDPTSSEIDYRIKLDVENFNLVGETFNEIGLVMADCKVENGVITEIKKNSGVLATRVTFTPITLSTQLLTQFSMYYHIYI